jgi:arylformamidase
MATLESKLFSAGWIDLSYPLSPETPLFPGSDPVRIQVLERTEDPPNHGRRSLNVSRLSVSVHTGTHMDAPFHFFPSGETIDRIALDRCVGPALLVNISSGAERSEIVLESILGLEQKLKKIPRVVLNTGWASRWGTQGYFSDHPCISERSADFLVRCGVQLVGIDTPSVDRPPFPAHLALLGNGIVIVENLTNLSQIASAEFFLNVVPLKLEHGDGSPVRALALNCAR